MSPRGGPERLAEPESVHGETHRTRIVQKLDLHNTGEIVLYAVRKKIVA